MAAVRLKKIRTPIKLFTCYPNTDLSFDIKNVYLPGLDIPEPIHSGSREKVRTYMHLANLPEMTFFLAKRMQWAMDCALGFVSTRESPDFIVKAADAIKGVRVNMVVQIGQEMAKNFSHSRPSVYLATGLIDGRVRVFVF